ncbi:helix-turn-helix domain-containing protein [Roseateles violae]|uniref:Helix-turn-helix domain-containing protein n=1 Tax=Roseateles violae TaxID=3058042 RepID=A0ABT8DZN5_9BURK|nr:helix-turn-helix domain-containing protein [Pelomonas sp. PFR6]MDN3923023.1 helix-turn-helix domain-containing protein [Pelomonas sp. PFR6]
MSDDNNKDDEGEQRMTAIDSELDARPAAAAASASTAGAWLRAARQQRGLHIAALAALLKVPQAKLEALEADRYQDLPDATFTRALAKAMCRALKVDAAPVMLMLPPGGERELDVSRGLNQPYRERGGREEGASLAWLQRPVVWGPLLLLVAAAVVYLLPAHWLSAPAPVDTAATPVAAPAPMAPIASEVAATPLPAASETVQSAAVPTLPPAAASAAPLGAVPALVAQASAPAPGELPLSFKAKADSWVQVVDARGQTLLSRLLRAGEQQELAGVPPLKVTIGNVAGTELSVRGAPLDLAGQSKDNVARLELN